MHAGDRALAVELGDDISPETNRAVRDLLVSMEDRALDGITDLVPSYRSILVHYDPLVIDLPSLEEELTALQASVSAGSVSEPRCVMIPVLYGGDAGRTWSTWPGTIISVQKRLLKFTLGRNIWSICLDSPQGFPI